MKRVFGLSSVVTTAVLAAGLAPVALASDGSAFGRHVAGCAQEHLGQRAAPCSAKTPGWSCRRWRC